MPHTHTELPPGPGPSSNLNLILTRQTLSWESKRAAWPDHHPITTVPHTHRTPSWTWTFIQPKPHNHPEDIAREPKREAWPGRTPRLSIWGSEAIYHEGWGASAPRSAQPLLLLLRSTPHSSPLRERARSSEVPRLISQLSNQTGPEFCTSMLLSGNNLRTSTACAPYAELPRRSVHGDAVWPGPPCASLQSRRFLAPPLALVRLEVLRHAVEAHGCEHHLGRGADLELVAEVGGVRRLGGGRQPLVATVRVLELHLNG